VARYLEAGFSRKKLLVLLGVVIMGTSRLAGVAVVRVSVTAGWSVGARWHLRPLGVSMDIDPRVFPWRKRQGEIVRLGVLRIARHSVCGCSRCGNAAMGPYLDGQIHLSEQLVAQYDDECCERLPDDQGLRAMEGTHARS
jgi:hypothetical protein